MILQESDLKIADEIAKKVGIGSNSDYRIISGIFYTLMRALNEGHVFLPKRILCRNAAHILGVTPEDIEEHLFRNDDRSQDRH